MSAEVMEALNDSHLQNQHIVQDDESILNWILNQRDEGKVICLMLIDKIDSIFKRKVLPFKQKITMTNSFNILWTEDVIKLLHKSINESVHELTNMNSKLMTEFDEKFKSKRDTRSSDPTNQLTVDDNDVSVVSESIENKSPFKVHTQRPCNSKSVYRLKSLGNAVVTKDCQLAADSSFDVKSCQQTAIKRKMKPSDEDTLDPDGGDSSGTSDPDFVAVPAKRSKICTKRTIKSVIEMDKVFSSTLNEYQIKGMQFMHTNCIMKDRGCVLSHFLGSGKTLEVVTFAHTMMAHAEITRIRRVLVVCPFVTVNKWSKELVRWLDKVDKTSSSVFSLWKEKTDNKRMEAFRKWEEEGGVGIITYELFVDLVHNANHHEESNVSKQLIERMLVDPGPNVIICDQAQVMKHPDSKISQSLNRVRTVKRIALIESSLKDNLLYLFAIVNFTNPNIFDNLDEFKIKFIEPINKGRVVDASKEQIGIMKRRLYMLYNHLLYENVHRLDYSDIVSYLPQKQEYRIVVSLSSIQKTLYEEYITYQLPTETNDRSDQFTTHFMTLSDIIAHPKLLSIRSHGTEDMSQNLTPYCPIAFQNLWWTSHFPVLDSIYDIHLSRKLVVLLAMIKSCAMIEDRVVVIGQNSNTLDIIEESLLFMYDKQNPSRQWRNSVEYFRIDLSTSVAVKQGICERFNNETSTAKLLLMSAGAMDTGFNLNGTTRLIHFDVSLSNSNTKQSITRVYNIGQKRTCHVYHLVGEGTIEEKVLNNEPDLYHYDANEERERVIQSSLPRDIILSNLLKSHEAFIVSYSEHDALLVDNKDNNVVSEEDKHLALIEFNVSSVV